jgi:hypothetical protein
MRRDPLTWFGDSSLSIQRCRTECRKFARQFKLSRKILPEKCAEPNDILSAPCAFNPPE